MSIILNGSLGITTPTYGGADTAEYITPVVGMKNRIINGAMMIDQRNAGASVTPTSSTYTLDRFRLEISQASKLSVQQNAGSVTPPAGFTNYLGITSTSSYSVTAGDFFLLSQRIEGFNVSDFGWGTANAQSVTLSFRVRSSLTGTFGGVFTNSDQNRSYPFSYTITAANTWTTISVTVAGDTSGTWLTNNGIGLFVYFGLGVGSTYGSGTAGAWAAGNIFAPTGSVSVVATNGATFYITGVQLEKGTTATSFDYRPYGTELALCQRYLPAFNSTSVTSVIGGGYASSTNAVNLVIPFLVQTRVFPTGVSISSASHIQWASTGNVAASTATFNIASNTEGIITMGVTAISGQGGVAYFNNTSGQILFNGCEL